MLGGLCNPYMIGMIIAALLILHLGSNSKNKSWPLTTALKQQKLPLIKGLTL